MAWLDPHRLLRARVAHAEGRNVTETLRADEGLADNCADIIEIAYDLQAGNYVEETRAGIKRAKYFAAEVAAVLGPKVGGGSRLLDIGTGEMTTLALVLAALPEQPAEVLAFDISWSRLASGLPFVEEVLKTTHPIRPFVAEIGAIPLPDGAVDVVTSSHALEPNGGALAPLLAELFRVVRDRLVLCEPCWERASPEVQARMNRLGYIRGLEDEVVRLGGTVEQVIPFEAVANKLNPTFAFVIAPPPKRELPVRTRHFAVPGTSFPLVEGLGYLHSPDTGLTYPILNNFPILRPSTAILASGLSVTP